MYDQLFQSKKACFLLSGLLLWVSFFFLLEGVAQEAYDSTTLQLTINYGEAVTRYPQVVLSLQAGPELAATIQGVEFSLDQVNWQGYQPESGSWVSGQAGPYQTYYPNFDLAGTTAGIKTVYARVTTREGNQVLAKQTVEYLPPEESPAIQLAAPAVTPAKGKLPKQTGTEAHPYYIGEPTTRLAIETVHVSEISFLVEGGTWSSWQPVTQGTGSLQVSFGSQDGLKVLYLRYRDKWGMEGEMQTYYFYLDQSDPVLQVSTPYHRLMATEGRLVFDLSLYDAASTFIGFEVEIQVLGETIIQEGVLKRYLPHQPTTTTITIQGLPQTALQLKLTATDQAGNQKVETYTVPSF